MDFTYRAFDLADRYRYPVLVLLDGFVGAMMEPVTLPPPRSDEELTAIRAQKSWACLGRNGRKVSHEIQCGAGRDPRYDLQTLNKIDNEMYEGWEREEAEWEEMETEDAELIITAFGIAARIARSAVSLLRKEGLRVGLIRPKKVHPFPTQAYETLDYGRLRGILCAEMSIPAQFAVDVRNAVRGRAPVDTILSSGGVILDRDDILQKARALYEAR